MTSGAGSREPGRRVVVLSSSRWAAFMGSIHYVTRALAELGHVVLYVDPPLSPLSLIRHPDRLADLRAPAVEVIGPGLRRWVPRVVPGQNSRLGQAANARMLAAGIRRLLPGPDLVICSSLEGRGVLARMQCRRAYCCIDSFEDLPGNDPAVLRDRERGVLAHVDVAVACSRPLERQLRDRGARVVYVPHGCDPAFLVPAGEPASGAPPPAELAGRPRPWVGYVGSLNFRIDPALLDAARRGADGGTLVVVGGAHSTTGPAPDEATRRLLGASDVVAVGHQPTEELPRWLGALDVGLVPYRATAFDLKSYPLKIPQYLAAGLPVVSTANGATEDLVGVVTLAESPTAFEDAVRRAWRDDTPEARWRRRQIAATRPWTVVAGEMLDAVAASGVGPA